MKKDSLSNLSKWILTKLVQTIAETVCEIVTEIELAGTRLRLRIQPKMFPNVRERRIAKERLPRREY